MTLSYSLEVDHDNRHRSLLMPTSCPMGVLDALCLDDKGDMTPSFRQMMCCVPKGRAIVSPEFYGETKSNQCREEDVWGISALDSQRLVAEL
eukprot:2333173-Ditylum_brightwellii.AAC.1